MSLYTVLYEYAQKKNNGKEISWGKFSNTQEKVVLLLQLLLLVLRVDQGQQVRDHRPDQLKDQQAHLPRGPGLFDDADARVAELVRRIEQEVAPPGLHLADFAKKVAAHIVGFAHV